MEKSKLLENTRKFRGTPKGVLTNMYHKMKSVIQQTNDFKNYIVITDDGREFIVKDIDVAIELKDKLQDVQDTK